MGIPDHLTCLLRNLYAGQEATVRTGHGTTDWLQIAKGVRQGYLLSPCLFNFYAEYIKWNAGLDESQVGIKIARRNINNLRYADDTTLVAESEEELKSLLMRVTSHRLVGWMSRLCYHCSVTQSCATLPLHGLHSTLGSSVLRYLLKFAQTHVHWVSDAIQPSCPLSSFLLLPSIFSCIRVFSSKSALCISILGQSLGASASASVLPVNMQDWFL